MTCELAECWGQHWARMRVGHNAAGETRRKGWPLRAEAIAEAIKVASAGWWPLCRQRKPGRPLRTLARRLTEKAPPEGGILTVKQPRSRLFEVRAGNPQRVARGPQR